MAGETRYLSDVPSPSQRSLNLLFNVPISEIDLFRCLEAFIVDRVFALFANIRSLFLPICVYVALELGEQFDGHDLFC